MAARLPSGAAATGAATGWRTAAAAALLLGVAALLASSSSRGWRAGGLWTSGGALLGGGGGGGFAVEGPCRHWASTEWLPGGCVAQQEAGATTFACCSRQPGGPFGCTPCKPPVMRAVECIAPRFALLRPAPGCGTALPPPLPPPPRPLTARRSACHLDTAAVLGGKWIPARSTPGWEAPGAPGLFFSPTAACAQRLPGPATIPGCLLARGFDRVVVSGDSTVRHLFSRLLA